MGAKVRIFFNEMQEKRKIIMSGSKKTLQIDVKY
jgi:hypothetical protein